VAVWFWLVTPPLQNYYLITYLDSTERGSQPDSTTKVEWLLKTAPGRKPEVALGADVVSATIGNGNELPVKLSSRAVADGWRGVVKSEPQRVESAKLERYLEAQIFDGRGIWRMVLQPLFACAAAVLFLLGMRAWWKTRLKHEERHGRRTKGPEWSSPFMWNKVTKEDGIRFQLQWGDSPSSWKTRLPFGPSYRIPRRLESSHIMLMGDTGSGKSSAIRQILRQVQERGETAIVYDPALDYTPEFYKPERGDAILNPLDQRMPYWSPGDELLHPAEALTLAASLFPDRRNENPFFVEGPRKIFAHLLTFRPTPEEMAWWMCHEEEIDQRVKGTQYAAMINPQAPAQRSGVLASLNMVADSLKLLPLEKEAAGRWSAAAWSKERKGWLFLTSTSETRQRLLPLTSLWLDTLVLRLMNQGHASSGKVWFVLDELATLQRLPQLHTAVTENRKSNNPVVLGFQGRSQLETRYGHEAEAMLSQPATKIFLRTSECHAAEWVSRTIGAVERERLSESRSSGQAGQRRKTESYNLERRVEALVMDSEISGLANLRGYLKSGNLVVRMSFSFVELPSKHPKYIQRPANMRPEEPSKAAAAGAGASGMPGQKLTQDEISQNREHQLTRSGPRQEHFFE